MRDTLATSLATEFGITAKAVRDIWNLRTWAQTTRPSWTQADHDHFLAMPCSLTHLCDQCRAIDVRSRSEACEICAGPPRRGRPRMQHTLLPDAAAQVPAPAPVLQDEEEQEQGQGQAVVAAGAGAISSAGTLLQILSDGCFGVRPDPKVCAAVHDILAETALMHTSEGCLKGTGSDDCSSHGCSIGEPLLSPMLESHEESAGEESAATLFSRQGHASACADSDIFRCIELDDEEEYVMLDFTLAEGS